MVFVIWIYNGIRVFSGWFAFPFRIIPRFIFGCYSVLNWHLHKAIIIRRLHSWVLIINSESIVMCVIRILVLFPVFYHFTFIKLNFIYLFHSRFEKNSSALWFLFAWKEGQREKQLNDCIVWVGILHFSRCCT